MITEGERSGKLVRAVIWCVVLAGATYAVFRWAYLPYQCNIFKRNAERSTLAAQELNDPVRRTRIARQNLERSTEWIRRCPHDLDLYMIAGASLRQLGRSGDAVSMYQRALRLDRRPELYLNLGQSQAEANQIPEAIQNLAAAVVFDPSLIDEVPGPLQDAVRTLAASRSHV